MVGGSSPLRQTIPFEYYMTFIPFQHRPPQKYLRTEHRRFEFSHGSGIEVIDHYLDKNKKPQEMITQVIWDELPFSKAWQEKYGEVTKSRFLRY